MHDPEKHALDLIGGAKWFSGNIMHNQEIYRAMTFRPDLIAL